MQVLAAYTESFCIITPGSFLYRRVLYKYMLARYSSPKVSNSMKTTVAEKMSKTNRVFRLIDCFGFTVLMIFLVIIVISSSRANIHHDSIDYYAIVQRLTQNSGNPIARNLHFVEQRSPGYPIISLIPYYLIWVHSK